MDALFLIEQLKNTKTLETDEEGNLLSVYDLIKQHQIYSLYKAKYTVKDIDEFEFYVLKTLKKLIEMESLEYITTILSAMKNKDEDELTEYLFNENFVTDKLSKRNWQVISKEFSIPLLKNILSNHNLKLSGKKQVLVNRIADNINLDEIDVTFYIGDEFKYFISDAGLDYFYENEYKLVYFDVLSSFDFDEFEEFYMKNSDNFLSDIVFEFLKMHEENSIKQENGRYYREVLKSINRFLNCYSHSPEEKFINDIKLFTYNLNCGKTDNNKMDSRNISSLRKDFKKTDCDYRKCLLQVYQKTSYKKEFTYEKTLSLLEEVFNKTTMNDLEKIIKNMIR